MEKGFTSPHQGRRYIIDSFVIDNGSLFMRCEIVKLLVSGDELRVFSFGKMNCLNFSKNLQEIVVKDSEVVSYRFERDGMFYQISPYSYYESDELRGIFKDLMKKTKVSVSVIER